MVSSTRNGAAAPNGVASAPEIFFCLIGGNRGRFSDKGGKKTYKFHFRA